ncbi:hypothetical protein DPMN_164960 [Dreissena polymorpha]|uniref:Uncharacterized protein n=1 Tax=Dreissena polymorpha TaxID=45954 RepID=A0A9D4IW44_DREPO|nr:hypothetical protein DPMN_164960 [Dreissena polymorpha]
MVLNSGYTVSSTTRILSTAAHTIISIAAHIINSENHGTHRLPHNSQKRIRWSALRVILSAGQI